MAHSPRGWLLPAGLGGCMVCVYARHALVPTDEASGSDSDAKALNRFGHKASVACLHVRVYADIITSEFS